MSRACIFIMLLSIALLFYPNYALPTSEISTMFALIAAMFFDSLALTSLTCAYFPLNWESRCRQRVESSALSLDPRTEAILALAEPESLVRSRVWESGGETSPLHSCRGSSRVRLSLARPIPSRVWVSRVLLHGLTTRDGYVGELPETNICPGFVVPSGDVGVLGQSEWIRGGSTITPPGSVCVGDIGRLLIKQLPLRRPESTGWMLCHRWMCFCTLR